MVRAILSSLALMVLAAPSAFGHGDAAWIQANPEYKRLAAPSTHCCSKDHCMRAAPGEFTRVFGGWQWGKSGLVVPDNSPSGLYESIDLYFWKCSYESGEVPVLVCLFYPRTGT